MAAKRDDALTWRELAMFIGELAWLILTPWIGWNLGGGWPLSAVLAAVCLTGFVGLWAVFMAPRSKRRLALEERKLGLVLFASLITVLGGLTNLFIPTVIASALVLAGSWAPPPGRPLAPGGFTK